MYYRYNASRNSEGYTDMTACRALRNIEREERRERILKRDCQVFTKQKIIRSREDKVKAAEG